MNVDMAIDAITMKDKISRAVFATTDRDIIPLLLFLRDNGVTVHVVGCGVCKELKLAADSIFELTEEYFEDETSKSKSE